MRLFSIARNKRTCFLARFFEVQRANTCFVLRLDTRKQDFRGTLRMVYGIYTDNVDILLYIQIFLLYNKNLLKEITLIIVWKNGSVNSVGRVRGCFGQLFDLGKTSKSQVQVLHGASFFYQTSQVKLEYLSHGKHPM